MSCTIAREELGLFIVYAITALAVAILPTLHEAPIIQFFSKCLPGSLIFPEDELKDLWNQLRYDSRELNNLLAGNDSDCLLLWLLNISLLPSIRSIPQIINWLDTRLLAEEPQGSPTIREMLEGLASGKMTFSKKFKLGQPNTKPVLVYIDTEEKGLIEWPAVNSFDRKEVFLGNNWCTQVN